jgi:hypothetical protein
LLLVNYHHILTALKTSPHIQKLKGNIFQKIGNMVLPHR